MCGGKSHRMGQPKHLLPFGDECLLQRVVGVLTPLSKTTCVVAAADQEMPSLPEEVLVARDEQPDLGPLSGLATGLKRVSESVQAVYVSSCDAPFLNAAFVSGLASQLGGHDIVIVKGERHFHPLAAVYRTRIAGKVCELVDARRLRPIFLLEECDARVVMEEDMREFDPDLLSLRNMNTPDDYRDALVLAGFEQEQQR